MVAFLLTILKQYLRSFISFSWQLGGLEAQSYNTNIETVVVFSCDLEVSPKARAKNVYDHRLYTNIRILIDILDKYDIKGVFFVEGNICLNYAELIEELYRNGHEIGSHGFAHIPMTSLWFAPKLPTFSCTSARVADIKKSKNMIRSVIGKVPVSFRAPYLAIDENMLMVLEKEGFLVDSSLYNHTFGKISFPYHPSETSIFSEGRLKILEVPLTVSPIPERKYLYRRYPHILELNEKQMEKIVCILSNLFYEMKLPFALFMIMIHPYELDLPIIRYKISKFLKVMAENNASNLTLYKLAEKYKAIRRKKTIKRAIEQ